MDDSKVTDFDIARAIAPTAPPRVEVVVIPDSPAGLYGDLEPSRAPAQASAPVVSAPAAAVGKPTTRARFALPSLRFARPQLDGNALGWVLTVGGVAAGAGVVYLVLTWVSEALAAVGGWVQTAVPLVLLAMIGGAVSLGASRLIGSPRRTERARARVPAGASPGAMLAGVRRVLHGNRGAAAEAAQFDTGSGWAAVTGSPGYGGHSPGVVGSAPEGVEIEYPTRVVSGVEVGFAASGHQATDFGLVAHPGVAMTPDGDAVTDPVVGGVAADQHGYSPGELISGSGAGLWTPGQVKPRAMTRPAQLASWFFGPDEVPTYGMASDGVLSRQRWGMAGGGAAALDPSIDRTFSAWLFDESAPWMQGSGVPSRGGRLSIEDMTLTHRWCERMRNASASEELHGQWSSGQGIILGFGAPCRFCAVGFLFDESNPDGWSSDGSVFSHSDAPKLFARYGRNFLMGVSNIFEGGAPLPEVADYVEANCV